MQLGIDAAPGNSTPRSQVISLEEVISGCIGG